MKDSAHRCMQAVGVSSCWVASCWLDDPLLSRSIPKQANPKAERPANENRAESSSRWCQARTTRWHAQKQHTAPKPVEMHMIHLQQRSFLSVPERINHPSCWESVSRHAISVSALFLPKCNPVFVLLDINLKGCHFEKTCLSNTIVSCCVIFIATSSQRPFLLGVLSLVFLSCLFL